jgi:hypothetical protein
MSLPHHVRRLLPCGGDSRGLSEGRGKQGRQRDARATQPPTSTGGSVGEGLSVGRLSGCVKGVAVGRKLSTRPNFRATAYRWVYLAE